MSSALQNRLVGTIILVALVVIFLPDILDGKKQTNQKSFVEFPSNENKLKVSAPAPFPMDEVVQATQRPIQIVDDVALDDLAQSETDAQKDIDNSQTPQASDTSAADADLQQQTMIDLVPDNAEENTGWVVQLGSFRHQKNVNELLDKLDNAGYRAFSRKVQTSVGRLNKVFVGPELDKSKLEAALPHLKETTGLSGKISPFEVNE